jgi:hypothetical protein
MLFLTTNVMAQYGKQVKVANNNELIQAMNDPSVTSIEITQDGYYDELGQELNSGYVVTLEEIINGSRATCTLSITKTDECFDVLDPSSTVEAFTSLEASCPLQPAPGSGFGWVGGAGVVLDPLADPTDYSIDFTVPEPGSYSLTYNWDAVNSATTVVHFFSVPVITLTNDPSSCETIDVDFEIDRGIYYLAPEVTQVWEITDAASTTVTITTPAFTTSGSVVSGTLNFDPADYASLLSCGSYTLKVTATNPAAGNDCGSFEETSFYLYDTPVGVSAGPDQDEVCGVGPFATTLTGDPGTVSCDNGNALTVGWTVTGPGTVTFDPVSATTNTVGVSADVCGVYTFTFTSTNGDCSASDDVVVTFTSTPTNVDAGLDQMVCEDPTLGYTADLSGSYDGITCGTPTVEWTKVSGPGHVTFDPDPAITDDVTITADACGTYEFAYWVTNGTDCTVSNTVQVDFYDLPYDVSVSAPEKVCGYETTLEGFYTVDCDNGGTPTVAWTSTPSLNVIFGTGTDAYTTVEVPECGEYVFTFTVTNSTGCTTEETATVTFYETPDPVILGDTIVYTCSTTDYVVDDLALCNVTQGNLVSYTWTVTGGLINGVTNTITATSVSITWDDDYDVDGTINLAASIDGLQGCTADATEVTVDKIIPTLEGQIKYWNAFETYMPTPYPTDLYGTFPEDYFYVTLYHNGLTHMDSLETVVVQPRLMEDLTELMSYFDFEFDTKEYGCDAEYVLKVWDGGLVYHNNPPPPENSPTYLGASYTYNNWGGVNATDAYAIQLMATSVEISAAPYNYTWVGDLAFPTAYGYYSYDIADVNNTGTITALDGLTAKYRAIGLLGSYPDNGSSNMFSPNFVVTGRMVNALPEMTWSTAFNAPTNVADVPFVHSGNEYMYFQDAINHKYTSDVLPWEGKANYINLYYEAVGDVNASYVPTSAGFKAESAIELNYEGLATTNIGDEMTVSINIDNAVNVNAISLNMNYRNDLIEVLGTNYSTDDVLINQEEGILNIGWFSMETVDMDVDASVAQIRVRILAEIPVGTKLFELNANTELADATATPISDVNLKTIGLTTEKGVDVGTELTATNYPNPFANTTTISYTLPETGRVTVEVYNNLGMLVTTLVDATQESGVQNVIFNSDNAKPGVYFYHITVQGETKNFSAVKRMIVTQ